MVLLFDYRFRRHNPLLDLRWATPPTATSMSDNVSLPSVDPELLASSFGQLHPEGFLLVTGHSLKTSIQDPLNDRC